MEVSETVMVFLVGEGEHRAFILITLSVISRRQATLFKGKRAISSFPAVRCHGFRRFIFLW